jgi:hypothetical protein
VFGRLNLEYNGLGASRWRMGNKEMVHSRVLAFVIGLGGLAGLGCGGNGSAVDNGGPVSGQMSNNSASNAPSSGDVGVFVTDNLSDKYDHVWVSIKKIELKLAAGGTREIFSDPVGLGIDLSSLHDESGPKYQFLNQLTLPAGTYSGALITLDKNAVLFPTNTTAGAETEIATQAVAPANALAKDKKSAAPAVSKDAVLDVTFDPPKMLGTGHDDLVLDFDLSQWKEDGGKVVGVVTTSMGAGLEAADRNGSVVESGVVNTLKGDVPQQNFILKNGDSTEIQVQTTSATALVGLAGAGDPVLTKGQNVEVSGSFDTNTRRLTATTIKVTDPKVPVVSQVQGVVSAIDPKTGSWKVTPSETRGLLPAGTTIPVTLATDARFTGPSGLTLSKDDFMKGLSAEKSVSVLVSGSYDSAKALFTVGDARILNQDAQPAVKVAGLVSNPKTDALTFGLTVSDYEGLFTKPGAAAVVAVTPTTTFADQNGKTLTTDQFFGALAAPTSAQVNGVLDTSTGNVVANSIKLAPAPATPAVAAPKKKAKTK